MSTLPQDSRIPTYIVYQMGKVGSSTVYNSLLNAGVSPLHKVHYLSDKGLARGRQLYRGFEVRVDVPHERSSQLIRRMLRHPSGSLWRVISVVREPIARDVSAYIEMVDLLHPRMVATGSLPIARIARACSAQFLGFQESQSYTCQWFDDELASVFPVDVYEHPFDWQRGWIRVQRQAVDLLVLRLEDMTRICEEALSEFTGTRVKMIHASSRSPDKLQTAYAEDVYSHIVRRIRIPESICRRVYSSRYAKHFYRPEEIESFVRRWSQGDDNEHNSSSF